MSGEAIGAGATITVGNRVTPVNPSVEMRRGAAEGLRGEILARLRTIEGFVRSARRVGAVEMVVAEHQPSADGTAVMETLNTAKFVKLIERLLWLLGLSGGERAFVHAAASSVRAGDVAGAYEGLMVFADWLEDAGRTADAGELRRLVPETGDVLVVCAPAEAPKIRMAPGETEYAKAQRAATAMMDHLTRLGRDVCVAAVPHGSDAKVVERTLLDTIRREMRRRADRDARVELAASLLPAAMAVGASFGTAECIEMAARELKLKHQAALKENAGLRAEVDGLKEEVMRLKRENAEPRRAARRERVACARLAEDWAAGAGAVNDLEGRPFHWWQDGETAGHAIADAIRDIPDV